MSRRTSHWLALLGPVFLSVFAVGWSRAPVPAPRRNDTKTYTNSLGMKLIHVPAGKFRMGSPKGETWRWKGERQHEVEITRAFYLGAYEVTQKQFKEVMGYHPSHFSRDGAGQPGRKYLAIRLPTGGKGKLAGVGRTEDFPVENVSWDEAVAFCKKLTALGAKKRERMTYRLPTEAEWEYACRGATTADEPFHFAKPAHKLSSKEANFDGSYPYPDRSVGNGGYLGRPCKVGSYRPNKLGLYDMHGNVHEWCSDWADRDYYAISPAKDPRGPAKGTERVMRGGGWDSDGGVCRAAARMAYVPHGTVISIGFRVAADRTEQ